MFPAIFVLGFAMYAAVPVTAFTGLRRCMRARSERSCIFLPSLIGFGFGLASALLALSTEVWAVIRGGFAFYAPALMRIYGIGGLLSLAGILAGLGGVWKKNPLRWHALALSLGMLLLWFLWAASE